MATATQSKPATQPSAGPQSQDQPPKAETALATPQPAKTPIPVGASGIALNSIEAMYRFANAVALSGWAPKGMERPEAIVVAIQYGLEVGLTPMSALQNIAVINGRPSMYGDAQLALIRASGKCDHFSEALTDDASHPLFIELNFAMVDGDEGRVQELRKQLALAGANVKLDKDDQGFSACTVRKGGQLEFDRFTVADAKRADLWGKSGPWKQHPKRMLKFRARSFLLRDNYGDVLKGLVEVGEAWDSVVQHNPNAVAALPLGRSSLRGTNGAAHVDEQTQPGPTVEQYHQQEPPADAAAPATKEQWSEIDQIIADRDIVVHHWRDDWKKRHDEREPNSMTQAEAAEEINRLMESTGGE